MPCKAHDNIMVMKYIVGISALFHKIMPSSAFASLVLEIILYEDLSVKTLLLEHSSYIPQ